jgi:hypothetical protein
VQLGKAHRHQNVAGQDKAQRRGGVIILVLAVGGDRDREGEDVIFVLQAAGEFYFFQLFARRDVQPVKSAGPGDLLIGGIEQINPDRPAA